MSQVCQSLTMFEQQTANFLWMGGLAECWSFDGSPAYLQRTSFPCSCAGQWRGRYLVRGSYFGSALQLPGDDLAKNPQSSSESSNCSLDLHFPLFNISLQRFNAMVTYGPPYGHVHDWYKLVQCDPKSCRKTASSGVLTEPSRLALQGLSWEMGASNHYTATPTCIPYL